MDVFAQTLGIPSSSIRMFMSITLPVRMRSREPLVYEAIAFVLVKMIGILLWTSLSQEKTFRQQLVRETKRLTLSYLQSYL